MNNSSNLQNILLNLKSKGIKKGDILQIVSQTYSTKENSNDKNNQCK